MKLSISILVMVLFSVELARASQDPPHSEQEIREWFEKQVATTAGFPPLSYLSIRWTKEDHVEMPPDEMAQMAREIGPLIDHPLGQTLKRAREYRQFGPTKYECQLWALGSGA